MTDEDILWIALSRIRGIGIKRLLLLYNSLLLKKGLQALYSPEVEKLLGVLVFKRLSSPGFMEICISETKQYLQLLQESRIEIIPYTSGRYPGLLRLIPDPPVQLYCRGDISVLDVPKKVAVVGTRRPTGIGKEQAKEIAAAFAEEGFAIVSGLAAGIDTAAHIGALSLKGATIAVLPGSLDNIYPRDNIALADRIAGNGGLLLTEYPPGTEMQKRHFVERDRIQSGLSLGVCVVQTEAAGGAMHTAAFCRKHGRLLFCPQPVESVKKQAYSGIVKLMEKGIVILDIKNGYHEVYKMLYNNYSK